MLKQVIKSETKNHAHSMDEIYMMDDMYTYRKISNIRRTKSPTTSEWWTILLLTKVRLILETWQYSHLFQAATAPGQTCF